MTLPCYGVLVEFDCEARYVLKGVSMLQCGEDGAWNGMEPTCRGECACARCSCSLIG